MTLFSIIDQFTHISWFAGKIHQSKYVTGGFVKVILDH
jgi:hypothetical protein